MATDMSKDDWLKSMGVQKPKICIRCQAPHFGVHVWVSVSDPKVHEPVCFLCALRFCFKAGKVSK